MTAEREQRAMNRLRAGAGTYACGGFLAGQSALQRSEICTSLLFDRLERKMRMVEALRHEAAENWNQTFYLLYFRTLGDRQNQEAYLTLARRVSYKTVLRERLAPHAVESLLFGASGLLALYPHDTYTLNLARNFEYLAAKYDIEPLDAGVWELDEIRPANHPVLRLAQAAEFFIRVQRTPPDLHDVDAVLRSRRYGDKLSADVGTGPVKLMPFERRDDKDLNSLAAHTQSHQLKCKGFSGSAGSENGDIGILVDAGIEDVHDDERIAVEKMQRIVENVLEQEHLLVKLETFENGEEFLKQYVIRDDELVILDLDMPVKNGIDVLQELEKIQRNEVVILVTAYDNLALKTFSYGPFQIVRKEQMEGDRQISEYTKKKSGGIGISDKGRTNSCETGGYCIF